MWDDTSVQKRFIKGVEQLQKENNISIESDSEHPKNSIHTKLLKRKCKQEEIIKDKQQNNNADDIISIGMKRTRNNASEYAFTDSDDVKQPQMQIQNIKVAWFLSGNCYEFPLTLKPTPKASESHESK